jgi:hypothetical protein
MSYQIEEIKVEGNTYECILPSIRNLAMSNEYGIIKMKDKKQLDIKNSQDMPFIIINPIFPEEVIVGDSLSINRNNSLSSLGISASNNVSITDKINVGFYNKI